MFHDPDPREQRFGVEFQAPEASSNGNGYPVPHPRNVHQRKREGYVSQPVEEAVLPPVKDPRVVYLEERSAQLGEVQYPADEVTLSSKMAPARTVPWALGTDLLMNWDTRVRAREGSRLKRQLRFNMVVLLISVAASVIAAVLDGLPLSGSPDIKFGVGYSGFCLFSGVWSLATMYHRVRAYGWLPSWRVLTLSLSNDEDVVNWRKGYGSQDRMLLSGHEGRRSGRR